jgi:hypothetical protein
VRAGDAYEVVEQKMVDTMICCDLLALALHEPSSIGVMSDDLDLLPALAMAGKLAPQRVHLVRSPGDGAARYSDLLEEIGVTRHNYPPNGA